MRAKVESNSFQSCGVVRPKSEARNTIEVAHVGGRDLIMGAICGGLQGLYQQEAGTGSRSRESNPGTSIKGHGHLDWRLHREARSPPPNQEFLISNTNTVALNNVSSSKTL